MSKAILINGKIYTEDKRNPWAEAVAMNDGRFACVGTVKEVRAYAKFHWGEDFETVDLEGKTVLPGLIEGHTHPAMMSKSAWVLHGAETETEDEMYADIRKFAERYPKEMRPYFVYTRYLNEWYGPEGPDNRRLNEIITDRPARIEDNSGHGCLYNDIALEMLKDENGIPYNSSPISPPYFVKDADGNYTGWAQQALLPNDDGIYQKSGFRMPDAMSDELSGAFFDTFHHYGITVCMDGFTETEGDVRYLYEKDMRGELNMYYEATCVLPAMNEEAIGRTIATIRDWQKKYTTDHIHCNVMKYFMDGSIEFGDVLLTEPYLDVPGGKPFGSGCHCTKEEMTDLMVRLNRERIDLHIHCVSDGGLRIICDACEEAQKICGDDWCIYVTPAHCELIDPDDIHRIHKLGMFMDTTPIWSGQGAGAHLARLGYDRWSRLHDYTQIIADGEHVGFSSDVIEATEMNLLNPFTGISTGMTRLFPEDTDKIDRDRYFQDGGRPPVSARLTLEQMIHGYTVTNAIRMRLFDRLGSIETGKAANLVVLKDDIFAMKPEDIWNIETECVYFEGRQIYHC